MPDNVPDELIRNTYRLAEHIEAARQVRLKRVYADFDASYRYDILFFLPPFNPDSHPIDSRMLGMLAG